MKNAYDYLNDVTVDFSKYEEIKLSEKELKRMKNIIPKKKVRFGRIAAVAACVAMIAAFSQTAFAKQLMDRIIKTVSTGHNSFTQYDPTVENEIPDMYKGLFFDAEGNELKALSEDTVIYDADGNKITDMVAYLNENLDSEEFEITSSKRDDYANSIEFYADNGYSILQGEELEGLIKVLDFTPPMPTELPEGFGLTAMAYFDTDGKYATFIYTNADGKEILINERLLNEDTAFHMGTDGEIEELDINGHKAVLSNGNSLDWEIDDVSVGINGRGNITRDELISMAESVK